MSTYFIPDYVYFCTTPDAVVFLDLRRDCYVGLEHPEATLLRGLVPGWPLSYGTDATDRRRALQLAATLESRGLLTRNHHCKKEVATSTLSTVERRLYERSHHPLPRIRFLTAIRFALAYFRSLASLHLSSLEKTVRRIERRKHCSRKSLDLDLERTRELTGAFTTLRPFFYSAKNRCLLDSLVLIEFLALHDVFPAWVIGVKTFPFAAHSWVQTGPFVLNGNPGYVRGYVPILVV